MPEISSIGASPLVDGGGKSGTSEKSDVRLVLGLNFPALTAAYCGWKGEGSFEQIFFRAPSMTLWDFLAWNYQPTSEPIGCYVNERMIGIGWICKAFKLPDGRIVAEVGAAFFRNTPSSLWHRGLDLFLEHAFVARGFDAIYGVSPRRSAQAEAISRWCGMGEADGLPWGEAVPAGAVVRKLDRQIWEFNSCRRIAS
jgi:hypothetical protein